MMEDPAETHSVEEDFSTLPLHVLLTHKNWKARKLGFEQVRNSPMEMKASLMEKPKKIYAEPNTAAQEALFEALAALVPFCDSDELDILAGEPLRAVVEKGLTGRSRALEVSYAFIADLVAAGKQMQAFNIILPFLAHRSPKVRAAVTQLCGHIVDQFGVRGLPTKALFKAIQPLFNDANPQVRKEAANLCCQCYSYIGMGIKGCLTDIREVQLQELEKQFEGIVLGRTPQRCIQGVEASAESNAAVPLVGISSHGGRCGELDDDEYAACAEEAVLSRLPRNFYWVALDKTAKWQERVSMVQDHLLPLIGAQKIRQKDDYHELCTMIRELLIDPQAPLMLLGFKCIQEMARSLRAAFAPYARGYLNPLFDKMKDKKTSVIEHITTLLDALLRYHCVTLEQCHEEIENTLQSRVPNQRLALISWLTRLIDKLEPICFNRLCRSQNMLCRLLNDEKVEIREAGYVFVGRLIALLGEETFQQLLSSLDEKQRAKLSMILNTTANLQCTTSCSPARKAPRLERCADSCGQKPKGSICLSSSSALAANTTRSSQPGRTLPNAQLTTESTRMSFVEDSVFLESTLPSRDEACRHMLGLMGTELDLATLLRAKDWSTRYSGIQRLRAVVDTWSEKECTRYINHVIVYLRIDPGWRESIFQVFNGMVDVIQELVNRATTVSGGAGYAIISGCLSKLTEQKSKSPVCSLIMSLTKSLDVGFILRHIIGTLVHLKTPKLMHEANVFMCHLLRNGLPNQVDTKYIIDYVNNHCVEHSFPAVRTSGMALLSAVDGSTTVDEEHAMANFAQMHVMPNEERATTVTAKFSRSSNSAEVTRPFTEARSPRGSKENEGIPIGNLSHAGFDQPRPAAHLVKNNTNIGRASSTDNGRRTQSSHDNEENPGAADVGLQLMALARQIVDSSDWRVRLEGVKKVEELLCANDKCVSSNGATEIMAALCTRFDEANKNFVVDVLRTVTLVVESVGLKASRAGLKGIMQRVLGMLGDQKAALREEAARLASLSIDSLGLEPVLQYMQKPLTAESHTSNLVALELIEKGLLQSAEVNVSRHVANYLVPSVIRLCMSRILDVRSAAERVVGYLIPIVGEELVLRSVKSLRPAEQNSVMALIERQLQNVYRNGGEENARFTASCFHDSNTRFSNSTPRSQCSPRVGTRENGVHPRSLDSTVASLHTSRTLQSTFAASRAGSMSDLPVQGTSAAIVRNDDMLSIQEIMLGLRSGSTSGAMNACAEFLQRLERGEKCGTPDMIYALVERLHDNIKQLNVELALRIVSCLKAAFETQYSAQQCHTNLLFRLLGMIFECLLSESFSLHANVIKALNNVTLTLLERCPPNEVFCALMSRMTKYSSAYIESGTKPDLKYIQVTVKCLIKLGFNDISPENVIICCHEYLVQHPPSAFRNIDDISIRTVKTILQEFSRRCGVSLLETTHALVGTQNLVSHFIRSCLDAEKQGSPQSGLNVGYGTVEHLGKQQMPSHEVVTPTRSGAAEGFVAGTRHVDPQMPAVRASFSAGCNVTAAEEGSVVAIFSRIRNHETTAAGIEELYAFIKKHPHSAIFEQQFKRCSDAFRSYIRRKMERRMAEDSTIPQGFELPEIIRLTP